MEFPQSRSPSHLCTIVSPLLLQVQQCLHNGENENPEMDVKVGGENGIQENDKIVSKVQIIFYYYYFFYNVLPRARIITTGLEKKAE